MTERTRRTLIALFAGIVMGLGLHAQEPGPGFSPISEASSNAETLLENSKALSTSTPLSLASGAAKIASGSVVTSRRFTSYLSREREAIGVVTDVHMDFYPSDEYLRILPASNRPAIVAAPFRSKMKAETSTSTIPGAPSPTTSRLYRSDSSLASLVSWYGKEYGFDFKVTRTPLTSNGDTLTVARAVKRVDNTLLTVMIWNPTSNTSGRKAKTVSFTNKTSVEVQERAFRPRGELIVEGPDAVVELTWKVPYRDLIQKVSVKYQIDPHLVAALVQQESNFNPNAMSVDSAMGLTQMIPGTAAMMGVSDPTNPNQALDGGIRYLKMLLKRFKGNVEYALAGYNAGPGNVDKYGGIPPFQETRDYVRRIMARYKEKAGGAAASVARVVTPVKAVGAKAKAKTKI